MSDVVQKTFDLDGTQALEAEISSLEDKVSELEKEITLTIEQRDNLLVKCNDFENEIEELKGRLKLLEKNVGNLTRYDPDEEPGMYRIANGDYVLFSDVEEAIDI